MPALTNIFAATMPERGIGGNGGKLPLPFPTRGLASSSEDELSEYEELEETLAAFALASCEWHSLPRLATTTTAKRNLRCTCTPLLAALLAIVVLVP